MRKFVLDTSVLLKWFSEFGESDLDRALQLRDSMLAGTVFFIVPDFLYRRLSVYGEGKRISRNHKARRYLGCRHCLTLKDSDLGSGLQ